MRSMRVFFLPLFMLVFSAPTASSQQFQWAKLPGPPGGEFSTFYAASDQTLFTAVASRGIYKSTNGGQSWYAANNCANNDLKTASAYSFSTLKSGVLLVGYQSGVYTSSNVGEEWSKATGSATQVRSFYQRTDDSVLCAAYSGIFISDSTAKTWKQHSLAGIRGRQFLAINPSLLLLATDSGLYKSTNEGTTWAKLTTQMALKLAFSNTDKLRVYMTVRNGSMYSLYKSEDAAQTWQPVSEFHDRQSELVGLQTTEEGYVLLSVQNIVAKSTDHGATWTNMDDFQTQDVNEFARYQNGIVMAGDYDLIYFEMSDPHAYRFMCDGIAHSVLRGLAFDGAQRLYAVTAARMHYSDNRGQTWNDDTLLFPHPQDLIGIRNGGLLFWGSIYTYYKRPGQEWKKTSFQGGNPSVSVERIFEASVDSLFIGATDGLYLSTDGGITAQRIALGSKRVHRFIKTKSGRFIASLWASTRSEFHISDDAGITWKIDTFTNSRIYGLTVGSDGTLWAAGSYPGVIYKSTNDGNTWVKVDSINCQYTSIVAHANGHVDALSYVGLRRTTDKGATWVEIGPGGGSYTPLAFDQMGRGYMNVPNNGLYVSDRPLEAPAPRIAATSVFAISDVYPNPVSSVANVRFTAPQTGSTSLTVYNLLGEKVFEHPLSQQDTHNGFVSLNTSSLPTGTYRLVLGNGSSVTSRLMPVLR